MYRFLVIDDAAPIRQRVVKLLREYVNKPMEIREASDGEEALLLCAEELFDIIITDICMKSMNGLDFIAKMRERGSEAVFIIISGYDSFSFAQRSIEYGVSMYLLKPVDDSEFVKTIHRAIDAVHAKKDKNSLIREYEDQRKELQTQKISAFLWGGETDPTEAQKLCGLEQEFFSVLAIDARFGKTYCPEETETTETFRHIVNSVASQCFRSFFSLYDQDKRLIVVRNGEKELTREETEKFYEKLVSLPEVSRLGRVAIGVSPSSGSFSELSFLYRCAAQAAQERMVVKENLIFYGEDCARNRIPKLRLPIDRFRKLKEAIELNEKKAVNELLNSIFSAENTADYSYMELMKLCEGLSSYFLVNFFEGNPGAWGDERPQQVLEFGVENSDSIEEVCLNYKRNCYRLCDLFHAGRVTDSMNEIIIRKAKTFIENNLSREVTMAEVANYVDISYAHFSRIFKKVIGMNFVDYLSVAKIERAKQFLASSTMSVKDISAALGYRNSRYFSNVFKKLTGTLPTAYRLKMGIKKGTDS